MIVVEKFDKIPEIIEVDRVLIAVASPRNLKVDHKTILNHLHKGGFKKKLYVCATPIVKKPDGSNSSCKA
ncbi:hypothetical protein TNCT_525061 [Trichonephila clavata]|uniref:Uncharacterized protein n=1 Tax=Trichonephila clavata TaxID=2740835 RepID=A0A8X6KLX4_TRICU|nr:hypothetical protein TNCT_525061 [Trichonephila clavata]